MITIDSNNFDLSQYLFDLLKSNSSPQSLRNVIRNDIKVTQKQLSEQLSQLGSDEKTLDMSFNKLVDLKNQIDCIEKEINGFIENDLIDRINRLSSVCHQTDETIARYKHLSYFISKLEETRNEIKLIDELFDKNYSEKSCDKIMKALNLIEELNHEIETNEDLKTVDKDLNKLLDSFRTELIIKRQQLIHNIKESFNGCVKTFRDESKSENVFDFGLINCYNNIEFEYFINCLIEIKESEPILKDLIKSLNNYFVKPILNEEINELSINECKIIGKLSNTNTNCAPLSLLKLFFDHFSQVITNYNNTNNGQQLVSFFGNLWTENIFEQILKIYLNRLMPKNESEVSSYLRLVDEAEQIRVFLIHKGFINQNNISPFIEFATNIGSHFSSRLCTGFIINAKRIVSQDLHQTIQVGSTPVDDTISFPNCRVSQFVVELKTLIQEVIDLSNHCSTDCSYALNETIGNICELFIDISPVIHKKMITQFPQQNAIFHNNCIYLSFIIKSIAVKYETLIFLSDYISVLQQMGSEVFLKMMRSQEKQILGFIQNVKFCQCLTDITNKESSFKSEDNCVLEFKNTLKRCFVHLNFLKNAFIDVLPQKIYDKSIGTVVNTLLNEIIHKILLSNDISSSGAIQLSEELELISKDVKQFLGQINTFTFIPKWSQFCELIFILKANLTEIVDRWSDGKGILAAEYSAQEIKNLIRALFQNTERRAIALSKIKSSEF